MNKYAIMYTDAHTRRLNVVMFELEENVKFFIQDKVNSGAYDTKDFRVFMGQELYVEKTQQYTEITLSVAYKEMS